ncbi:YdhK family protein [Robertmurraya massiliosenegalensis]|uniref:YdhK family protein n=1 Tax=Robertmurraya massiliosenegalensis TaxID=1287657 RepID=UPI000305F3FD|nr:YdhK family protein [Robertmurraya massiliosenegalensis]
MINFKKRFLLGLLAALILVLGACGNNENTKSTNEETENANQENMDTEKESMDHSSSEEDMEGMDHSNMDMSSSGEVPEGLKEAENPTYPVGSKAVIQSDHMEGMKGAEATIVGAYDTTVYSISYTPTTGGEKVTNHKWVIHEELIDAGETPLEPGAEAKTEAYHMEGMEDATVVIDSAEETTVYMVDFTTTTGGEEVKNHKWVTESELSPVK